MQARRVLQRRSALGKTLAHRPARNGRAVTTFQPGTQLPARGRAAEADGPEGRIRPAAPVVRDQALRQLLADEHFSSLLRAEGLDTCPSNWPNGSGRRPRGMSRPPLGFIPGSADVSAGSHPAVAQDAGGPAPRASSNRSWPRWRRSADRAPERGQGRQGDWPAHPARRHMRPAGTARTRLRRRAVPDRHRMTTSLLRLQQPHQPHLVHSEHQMLRRAVERGVTPDDWPRR